jgi:hypothetical protein
MAAIGLLLFDKSEATMKGENVGSKHRLAIESIGKDRSSGVMV